MKLYRPIHLGALAAALALAWPIAQAASLPTPGVSKVNVSNMSANTGFDRFIITYRDGSTERSSRNAAVQNISAAISRMGLNNASARSAGASINSLSASYQRKLAVGSELIRTSRKLTHAEATTLMSQIAADPAVAHVEIDAMMHPVRDIQAQVGVMPMAVFTGAPNDPLYAQYQWHFNNPTGGADVEKAWSLADGAGVVVAVIDTGITQHPDLDMSLADAGYDFISDAYVSGRATNDRVPGGWDLGDWTSQPPYSTDTSCTNQPEASSWHGTHVSGNIAELTNNGVGMAGVAHNAKVLPVRVLGHCGGYTSDIADGIVWASGGHVDGVPDNANPAQVINMSLGGAGVCSATDVTGVAIAGAISRGTTVVVAAGNSNADAANYTPASCPGVITVGSNGITGKRAYYSNYGTTVTISAPGGGIYTNDDPNTGTIANPLGFSWSTVNLGTTTPADPGYGGMAGTSQATPHVSGTVALILGATAAANMPIPTPAQIKTLLTSTSRPFPVTIDKPIGPGILDAYTAVNRALGAPPPVETVTVLTNGQLLGGRSGAIGTTALYSLNVPAGAKNLSLRTLGGTGDVSVYVSAGVIPAVDGSDAQFKSVKPGNNEAVVIPAPGATTYYIRLIGVAPYAGVSVLGNYTM